MKLLATIPILFLGLTINAQVSPSEKVLSPNKLALISHHEKASQGECIQVTVHSEDASGHDAPVTENILGSVTGAGLGFYGDSHCVNKNSTFTIYARQDWGKFYYVGSKQGVFTMNITTAPSIGTLTQKVIVVAANK